MLETCPSTVEGEQNSTNSTSGTFSLENILGENHESLEHPGIEGVPAGGWDEEVPEKPVIEGFCIECEGQSF